MVNPSPQPAPPSLIATIAMRLLDSLIVILRTVGFLLAVLFGIPILLVPLTIIGPFVLLGFLGSLPFTGVYRSALTRVYMRHKLSPLFAAVVVTLCTMMVIIVISVMGGFLDLMRASTKRLSSDVIIASDLSGFPRYEQLADELRELTIVDPRTNQSRPVVASVTPVIQGFGLVKIGSSVHTVEVLGIDPDGYDKVTGYGESLYWRPERFAKQRAALHEPGNNNPDPQWYDDELKKLEKLDFLSYGMHFAPPAHWQKDGGKKHPGAVTGIEINPYQRRERGGNYNVAHSLLSSKIVVTLVPVSGAGAIIEPSVKEFIVVNEFKSGLYEVDQNRLYIPFDEMQKMMQMDAYDEVDDTGAPTGKRAPARTSQLAIRLTEGVPLDDGAAAIDEVTARFAQEHKDVAYLRTVTWRQLHATLLNAVENEKGLITFLFAIISLVAFVMVATVFYNIVLEKTRDIGVLRALGASRWGVANIFLGYGLQIGLVGGLLGMGMALLIVFNLNEINDWLFDVLGRAIWNPQTYYFDKVPEQVDPIEVTLIVVGAIMSSVLGSVIPAIVAARLDPVDALRYE